MLFEPLDNDQVLAYWRGADGALCEAELTLDQAAAIDRGDPFVVLGRGAVRRTTAAELEAAAAQCRARLGQVDAEIAAIQDRQWLRGLGIGDDDPPAAA